MLVGLAGAHRARISVKPATSISFAVVAVLNLAFLTPVVGSPPEQAALEIVRQTGHTDAIAAFALSPNGEQVLTGSLDGTLRLWDAASGGLLRAFHEAHTPVGDGSSGVRSVAFSPDGHWLASVAEHEIRVWDAASGDLIWTADGDWENWLWGGQVAFSPDGKLVLSTGVNENAVQLWDAATGQQLRVFKADASDTEVVTAAFSPDGRHVLTGNAAANTRNSQVKTDDRLKLWSVATGQLLRTFEGHNGGVNAVAFSPDGRYFLSGGGSAHQPDGTLRLWDFASGRLVSALTGHTGGIEAVAFSPDGRLALAADASLLRLWDVERGQLLKFFEGYSNGGSRSSLKQVAFSPDGRWVFAELGKDATQLGVWDVESGQLVGTIEGGTLPVSSIAVSPDGNRLFALSSGGQQVYSEGKKDSTLQVWDLAGHKLLRTIDVSDFKEGTLALSRDGTRMLVSGWGDKSHDTVRILESASGNLLRTFPGIGALSPDGRIVMSSGWGRSEQSIARTDTPLRMWDANSGKLVRMIGKGRVADSSGRIVFSPNGKRVISTGTDPRDFFDHLLHLWDATTGKLLRTVQVYRKGEPHEYSWVSATAFSPDSLYVLSGGNDHLRLWNAANGKLVHAFDRHSPASGINSVAFSPDGSKILSGGSALELWDTRSGKLVRSFKGHNYGITSVAFTPDGRAAISSSYDGTINFWSVESGALLVTFAMAKDGSWIALTPEGFFSGFKRKAEVLNVVRGLSVTTIDQVHQSLYNPDLIREKLAGDPLGEVRRASLVLDLEKVVASGPAPTVVIEPHQGGGTSGTDLVTLKARIADQGKGIGRIEWRINGVTAAVASKPSVGGPEYVNTQEVALDPGDNVIEVVAYNAENLLASLPARTSIAYTGPADAVKPTLHILAIGINRYVDQGARDAETGHVAQFEPLDLAVKDAKAITESLKKAVGNRYETVNVKLALDEEATRENLDAIVAGMAVDVHRRDTFVLFAAGHGYSSDGKFYLIPQDYSGGPEKAALEARAIGQERLQDWLANRIKAKRAVILLDTCESGALIAGHLRARAETAASEAGVGRLHEATGRSVLAAAALGQFAQEGLIASSGAQHGLFTYALLEALRDGDSNANGAIELSELVAHVQTRVPQLAADKGGTGRTIASSSVTDPGQQSARFGSRGEDFILVDRLR